MDWRDVLAWQNVKQTVVNIPGTGGAQIQLCDQNPHRIYLSISQFQGDDSHLIYPGAPMDSFQRGMLIGGGLLVAFRSPRIDTDGTFDPSGATFSSTSNVDLGELFLPCVPLRYEFWLDRHGALTQMQWWFSDNGCMTTCYVLEVIQDEAPCERPRKGRAKRGGSVQGVRRPFNSATLGSSGDGINPAGSDESKPSGNPATGIKPESVQRIIRTASGTPVGSDNLPRATNPVPVPKKSGLLGGTGHLGNLRDDGGGNLDNGTTPVAAPVAASPSPAPPKAPAVPTAWIVTSTNALPNGECPVMGTFKSLADAQNAADHLTASGDHPTITDDLGNIIQQTHVCGG